MVADRVLAIRPRAVETRQTPEGGHHDRDVLVTTCGYGSAVVERVWSAMLSTIVPAAPTSSSLRYGNPARRVAARSNSSFGTKPHATENRSLA